jgi:transposase
LRTVHLDGDRRSAQVERLEVVDAGRRRRWSEDEKLKIVLESIRPEPKVSPLDRPVADRARVAV